MYAILGHDNLIKIGVTTDVPRRLRELQTGSSVPLKVIAVRPGDWHLEKSLHRQFAQWRTTGEWFALPVDPYRDLLARFEGGTWVNKIPPPGPHWRSKYDWQKAKRIKRQADKRRLEELERKARLDRQAERYRQKEQQRLANKERS